MRLRGPGYFAFDFSSRFDLTPDLDFDETSQEPFGALRFVYFLDQSWLSDTAGSNQIQRGPTRVLF